MSATTHTATRAPSVGLGRMVVTGLLALAASVAVPAWGQGFAGGPGMGGPGMGGQHWGGPGMGGHGMMMGNPEHIGRMADRMLDGLNATEAQRTQIKQIAQAAAADMKTQHEAGRALREKGLGILTAPTVDAAAAEALRQQMLAQHDQASKRMLQAMLDIGKVLTPEQRAKVGERMKQRGEMMRDRMQRMQRGPEQKS
jgi:periplasmic protein CpxP/Spy